jgi:maltooligosyltrehalose trehalohydrolase
VFAGHARGEPSGWLSPAAFVAFLQTHDQIGNRAFGERLAQLTGPVALRAALTTLLLAPQIPMLFMGEEYAAPQPFLYFCDYTGELATAIAAGRRREFARFAAFASAEARERIPDPSAPQTFTASRLCWSDREQPGHADWLAFVRRLLGVRATTIVPLIPRIVPGSGASRRQGATVLQVEWQVRDGGRLRMLGNFGAAETTDPHDAAPVLFETHARAHGRLAPWEVRWTLSPL